ncbi:MAG: TrkH family potassium uptake protein [Oscillospiraceae bacterium]|jgi:trk system potassium uptake protein TrkH|nr:TrkH family potassium uptake protein [Oscillospiraceae bacterium]
MNELRRKNRIFRALTAPFRGGFYSKLLLIIGVLIAAPIIVSAFYPTDFRYWVSFAVPAVLLIAAGVLVSVCGKKKRAAATTEWTAPLTRGAGPVMFAWAVAIAAGAVPFVIGGQMSVVHALFESVSGWSTTGLTVSDVESMPHIFLLHRAFMQYCGGLGFVIFIGILIEGRQLANLYNTEGHPDSMMPNVRRASLIIMRIYLASLVLGSAVYRLLGMPLFDAICHTMSALSTAGFSPRAASIGAYNSLAIELFTIVLMLAGASNFAVLLLLVKGKFKRTWRVTEVRVMFAVCALFIPLTALSVCFHGGKPFFAAVREAAFGVVSIFTTTGYATTDYAMWSAFALGLVMLLMILGGSTGSTAGGIKLLRAYVVIRVTKENIRKRLSPTHEVRIMRFTRPQGTAKIDAQLITDTMEFVTAYMGILVAGTLALILTSGASLDDALFEFTSALGTIGISNGLTAAANPASLVLLMFGMLLGRLEIFIVFIGIAGGLKGIRRALPKILRGKPGM